MIFYFTYGTDDKFPFKGGWTEIETDECIDAFRIFKAFHPNYDDGFLNYSFCYPESYFTNTNMYKNGNFGEFCHERIRVDRELFTDERK